MDESGRRAGADKQPVVPLGHLVLLLTDGVFEARSPEGAQFGVERALEVVRSARHQSAAEIIESLREAVCRFAWQSKLPDDLTALVVKVETTESYHS